MTMDLTLRTELAEGYKSKSQIARIVTEAWFEENMYCPACPSNTLEHTPSGTKVIDFLCPRCDETFQLKSLSHNFGTKIVNSAYEPKVQMIREGLSPNWVFLQYDRDAFHVENVMIVPKHFMTPEIVERRQPLRERARRAGWVGSNLLIGQLSPDAQLYVVRDEVILPKWVVRKNWKRFEFLRKKRLESRGWLNDVLFCVRELGKKDFTLKGMYQFEDRLQKLHPDNRFVKPKIRQQLQVLRDHGILGFVRRGKYRLKD